MPTTTDEQQIKPSVEIDCDELIGVFTNFLQFDVANGECEWRYDRDLLASGEAIFRVVSE